MNLMSQRLKLYGLNYNVISAIRPPAVPTISGLFYRRSLRRGLVCDNLDTAIP
jgi:hypothetical protein